jgi:hypothetical protein
MKRRATKRRVVNKRRKSMRTVRGGGLTTLDGRAEFSRKVYQELVYLKTPEFYTNIDNFLKKYGLKNYGVDFDIGMISTAPDGKYTDEKDDKIKMFFKNYWEAINKNYNIKKGIREWYTTNNEAKFFQVLNEVGDGLYS